MAKVVVVYHSGYGHTAVIAKAVARGAESVAGSEVKLLRVEDVNGNFEPFAAADAIIFGCPTYMGSLSAPFKAFLDAASREWMKQAWKDKLAAGFTNSGSPSGDKLSTLQSLCLNAMQHSMIWVSLGVMPPSNAGNEYQRPDQINRLGSFLGAMAQSNNAAPEQTPPSGDIATGEHLGKRVAELAKRWVGAKA